jgi:23S rRNA U2552 (ribose-2'-O)-methylase RlmE/FtsJ
MAGGFGEEKGINLFPIYDRHFRRFKDLSPVVWEIGVNNGSSLKLWKTYFGGNSRIIGIDINPGCIQHANDTLGVNVAIGDATDPAFLDKLLERTGPPDVLIDDGSHKSEDIRKTFEHLYPKIARNGVYLVEDLHMAYAGGGPVENSFIDYSKSLMDEMNAAFQAVEPRKWFCNNTISMTCYESVIVFERGTPLLLARLQDRYLIFADDGNSLILKDRKPKDDSVKSPEDAPPPPIPLSG